MNDMEAALTGETIHHCLHCGKVIDPLKGREGRKYCDDICKSRYHNRLRKEANSDVKRIDEILKKNFAILKKVYEKAKEEEEPASISREKLLRLGFNFDYYTQVSGLYKFCYTFGYVPANNPSYIKVVIGFDSIVKKD